MTMKKATKKVVIKKPVQTATDNKVAGMYQQKSTMGKLFLLLSDQKPRTLPQLSTAAAKKGINIEHRLYWLKAHGKTSKQWDINKLEGGKVQMKLKGHGLKLVRKKAA